MRTTCAMDMVAMDGGVPTQTQLSILRRSSGLVMADAEFDEGLAPMADLPDFWGPAGAAGILGQLGRYPEVLRSAARHAEPSELTTFTLSLARDVNSGVARERVLGQSPEVTAARLALVRGARQVLGNSLAILGVGAPTEM